jgi:UDP-4-amino-4,6-dideoxy-N-acetyl-beta-L-altrosamine N-acetyltransferase
MTLRKIEKSDLELILKWRNHPKIRQCMFYQEIISLESHTEWYEEESEKENACWLIYSNARGKLSGVINCTNIDQQFAHGFWGFYTAPDAEPGTGTLMCSEGLDYFFEKFKLNKINAEVLESNERSHSFHKKLGFNIEGQFIDHYKNKSGFQTVTRYAIFFKDWLGHKGA